MRLPNDFKIKSINEFEKIGSARGEGRSINKVDDSQQLRSRNGITNEFEDRDCIHEETRSSFENFLQVICL